MLVALFRASFAPRQALVAGGAGALVGAGTALRNLAVALVPLALVVALFGIAWWYATGQEAEVAAAPAGLQQLGAPAPAAAPAPEPSGAGSFYLWYGLVAAAAALMLIRYYARMSAERFEVLKLMSSSMLPLGILYRHGAGGHPVRDHHGD